MILGEPVFEGEGRLLEEYVGVPGRDMLGLVEGDSPEAASVNRNSTHRRENDYGEKQDMSSILIQSYDERVFTHFCFVCFLKLQCLRFR